MKNLLTRFCFFALLLGALVFAQTFNSSNTSNLNTSPILTGTTGTITPGVLLAGACGSGTATVTGVTTGMSITVTPVSYPGDGVTWFGYRSGTDQVTVKVCAIVGLTPSATAYNVRVAQ